MTGPRSRDGAGRRCIIVAPFFPPSGLPPAHRARLFVRHLPRFGWMPTVITVDPRDREEPPEPALMATVPAGIRIESVRAMPARLTRSVGVGDLGLRALPMLAMRTLRVARQMPGAPVVLIVPPWYVMLMAPVVHRLGARVLVVDYVDPWRIADSGTRKSRLAARLAGRLEQWSLDGVRGVFAVSDAIVNEVQARFPGRLAAGAAPYGLDLADAELLDVERATPGDWARDDTCRLTYVGALSDSQLPVLAALLDAIVRLREREPALAARLRVELYGTTYAAPDRAAPRAAALVAARGLGGMVSEHAARIPYRDALVMAAGAGANLVLGDLTSYYAASKLMPMLAARRPIVALLHANTEPAAVLRRLGARGLVCYGTASVPSPEASVEQTVEALRALIGGSIPVVTADFTSDPALRARTAERMTEALADLLDRVTRREGNDVGDPR